MNDSAAPLDPQTVAERVGAGMLAEDAASRRARHGVGVDRARPCAMSMPVRADMLNGHTICHGGFIFTLADSAFAFACNSHNQLTVASGCGDRSPRAGTRGRHADGARARAGARRPDRRVRRRGRRTSAARLVALFRGKSTGSRAARSISIEASA